MEVLPGDIIYVVEPRLNGCSYSSWLISKSSPSMPLVEYSRPETVKKTRQVIAMGKRKVLVCTLFLALIISGAPNLIAQEPAAENIAIKMVLRNIQVKQIRKAEGETISLKLTNAQKKLIRNHAPKFRGNIIRISTAHLKKGTNKIKLLIIKPSSEIPLLRVIPPDKPNQMDLSSDKTIID